MQRNRGIIPPPRNTPFPLLSYLKQRNREYKALYKDWLNGTSRYSYAPATWPPGRCMLISLPLELMLLVCNCLYQADLLHLALTCRAFANIVAPLMYTRDIADFDCLSLRWACTFGVVTTLERALSHGASPDHVFYDDSHAKCSWVLTGLAVPHIPARFNFLCSTPLNIAIVANEPEIVRLLIEHGVDVKAPDHKASDAAYLHYHMPLYPIHLAMGIPVMLGLGKFQPGNMQVVRRLLDAGADPNQSTAGSSWISPPEALTPLLMAMQPQVPVETVKLLLERGANPTTPGKTMSTYDASFNHGHPQDGTTRSRHFSNRSPLESVLHGSLAYGKFALDMDKIQLLLMHGAAQEVVYMSNDHFTSYYPVPILYRYWDHPQSAALLRLFISHGADVASWASMVIPPITSVILWAKTCNYHARKIRTAQDLWVVLNKACELISLLAEATLVEKCPLSVKNPAIMDAVVTVPLHIKVIPPDVDGQTALRYACRQPHFLAAPFLIRLLLRYGADMNSTDSQGRSALHHASAFGSADRVRELVKFNGGPTISGLIVDALDARSWTPLHYACLFQFWDEPGDQVATARLLLESGANVHARTYNGWTPLSLAVLSANQDLVGMLLDHGAQASDLLLSFSGNVTTEPTLAPIGRIMFLHCTEPHRRTRLLSELVNELAVCKACVVTLLEHRLGISIPLPPLQENAVMPPGYQLDIPYATTVIPRFRIDVLNHPFGVVTEGYYNFTADDFEKSMDGILNALDSLGLEALLVRTTDPEPCLSSWISCPPP
ncbi:hypothetical protein C7999DRAFT_35008 [Corynascus novoguineensis]|uniref:F-box domain-containing protein n=1 Tax=Corynascus novoguineensis TaxID=1126955 RepID=A0AAN7CM29_9PEZI|nr:hypothetical protein C7999DRAFT_35008 [Corynascus novoguineensis]